MFLSAAGQVVVEVDVPSTTKGRDVVCTVDAQRLKIAVGGRVIAEGQLAGRVVAEDCIWTLGW